MLLLVYRQRVWIVLFLTMVLSWVFNSIEFHIKTIYFKKQTMPTSPVEICIEEENSKIICVIAEPDVNHWLL